ncbi:MAG: GH3 auxin-responsive promoter family protein [Muribaculaceae bacterium]|nr:GH3 auxin-responsive promoter family protein [Muribaculaceae bacterium]
MFNFTPLLRPYFARIAAGSRHWSDPEGVERVQRRLLSRLMATAAGTDMGRRHDFASLASYEDFASTVPVTTYEDIRPDVMRMLHGERDVLWPGRCRRFAQSSGTSGGKSKYIPVTSDALRRNHYAGAAMSVAFYLGAHSRSSLFGGKAFILGGSFANELTGLPAGTRVGDLSANLIADINPAVNLVRVPDKRTALLADWHEKLPRLVEASLRQNITNISGVPSWFLTVLRSVVERAGASTIHDVWPGLEVFFHGGISFGPYREQYAAITDPERMRYHECYNASEGFFAVQDTARGGSMRLLADCGVFFEFIPLDHLGERMPQGALPAWKVEPGRTYALAVTSCNGLWRHVIGDTVRIESVEPLRITVAGRTNSFINTFGEELMVWNAEAAIAAACHATGAEVADYTAAPVYTTRSRKGRHQWLIEWTLPPACGNEAFADILDAELQKVNSDYQAKRAGDIFLDRLILTQASPGLFDRWLESTGRLGGQRKIPRLANDRQLMDRLLEINTQ